MPIIRGRNFGCIDNDNINNNTTLTTLDTVLHGTDNKYSTILNDTVKISHSCMRFC